VEEQNRIGPESAVPRLSFTRRIAGIESFRSYPITAVSPPRRYHHSRLKKAFQAIPTQ